MIKSKKCSKFEKCSNVEKSSDSKIVQI
jgi:hypothetical protein